MIKACNTAKWYKIKEKSKKSNTVQGREIREDIIFLLRSLSSNHLEEEKQIRLIVLSSAAKKVLSQITCFKEGKNFKKEKSFFVNSEIGFSLSKNHSTMGKLWSKSSIT